MARGKAKGIPVPKVMESSGEAKVMDPDQLEEKQLLGTMVSKGVWSEERTRSGERSRGLTVR